MDRRSFIESCTAGAACAATLAAAGAAWAAEARPRAYPRALLVDERGEPLRAGRLQPQANYVFHYPFRATPVFLLDLGRPVAAQQVATASRSAYPWPGGVGQQRSIVAFCAICSHQLVYPNAQVSFISFRSDRARQGVRDGLIHCCAEHSQFDPARGAQVLSGPARQPLCAVLLAHDPKEDTLTAWATLGPEPFDAFFRKYEARFAFEMGAGARAPVEGRSVVRLLEQFCRNPVRC